MVNFIDLVNSAKNKGFKIDTYSTYFDRFGDETIKETIISINIESHVWYTWSICSEDINSFSMYFEGRYNQCNGAKQRSFKKERKALFLLGLIKNK